MSTTDKLAQAVRDLIDALASEGRAPGGFSVRPATSDHQRRVQQAWRGVHSALAAHESCAKACEAEKAAPTLCRVRTRIKRTGYTLVGTTDYPWTAWAECSPESADEFERSKDPQWEYEVQRLYTVAPAAPVADSSVAFQYLREQVARQMVNVHNAFKSTTPAAPVAVAVPLTDERIYEIVDEAGFDWHNGWPVGGEDTNRYVVLVRAVERACAARWGVKLEGGE